MDIKKYEVLLAAVDKGSLVKVCEEQGYTQSGLTHMMNSLEKEVGFPLLQRTNRGVRLTEEGRMVLPLIREIVRLNENLEQQFARINGLECGRVRIGTYPTIACAWLPGIIKKLNNEHPGIQVEVIEENSVYRLQKLLREGVIDLCYTSRQEHMTGEWKSIGKDPYYALLPADHPSAHKEKIDVGELMGSTFLMCKSVDGMDPDIDRVFTKSGIPITTGYTCNSDNTIVYMVEQGLGVSILPKLFLDMAMPEGSSRGIAVRPLIQDGFRELGVLVTSFKELSPAMEILLEVTSEELSGFGAS